jgi:hypothetical protein
MLLSRAVLPGAVPTGGGLGAVPAEAPPPPVGMVMPAGPQAFYTVLWGVVLAGLVAFGLWRLARHRDGLLLALLGGGAICYFAEPMVDVLGLLWHPVIGQWVAIDTFRAAPWWGVFVYSICFGGLPYLMWADFRAHGLTRRRAWTWIGLFWVVDLAVEVPILASGLYDYYGEPPMEAFGLPLYWLFMNIAGPLETAVLLLAFPMLTRGRWLLGLLAVPVSLDVTGSVLTGWPVFSALHAQASMPVKYLCALITVAIGVITLEATIRYGIRARTAAPEVTAVPA